MNLKWKLPLGVKESKSIENPSLPVLNYGKLYHRFALESNLNYGEAYVKYQYLTALNLPKEYKNYEMKEKTAVEMANESTINVFINDIEICHYECAKFFANPNSVSYKLIFKILELWLKRKVSFSVKNGELTIQGALFPKLTMPSGLIWVDFYQKFLYEFNSGFFEEQVRTELLNRTFYNPVIEMVSERKPSTQQDEVKVSKKEIMDLHSEIDLAELQAMAGHYMAAFFKPSRQHGKLHSLFHRLERLKPKLSLESYLQLKIKIIGKLTGEPPSEFSNKSILLTDITEAYRIGALTIRQYIGLLKQFSTCLLNHQSQGEDRDKNFTIICFSQYIKRHFDRFPQPRAIRFLRYAHRTSNPQGIQYFPKFIKNETDAPYSAKIGAINTHVRSRLANKCSGLMRDEVTQHFYEILEFLTDDKLKKSQEMINAIVDSYISRHQVSSSFNDSSISFTGVNN